MFIRPVSHMRGSACTRSSSAICCSSVGGSTPPPGGAQRVRRARSPSTPSPPASCARLRASARTRARAPAASRLSCRLCCRTRRCSRSRCSCRRNCARACARPRLRAARMSAPSSSLSLFFSEVLTFETDLMRQNGRPTLGVGGGAALEVVLTLSRTHPRLLASRSLPCVGRLINSVPLSLHATHNGLKL